MADLINNSGSHHDSFINEVNISHICGVIDSVEIERFKKLIFRASRGKVLSQFVEMDDNVVDP